MSFASDLRDTYKLDGAAFHLDPVAGASDPLRDYFAADISVMIRIDSHQKLVLDPKPITLTITLNEWLRLDRPGDYRLYVTTRRVQGARGPGSKVASNLVHLRILPRDPAADAMLSRRRHDGRNVSYKFRAGLASVPHRCYLRERLKKRLVHPEEPVDTGFLHLLTLMSFAEGFPKLLAAATPGWGQSELAVQETQSEAAR